MTVEQGGSNATARMVGAPLLAAFVLLALAWLGPAAAHATFPGENGKIAFERDGVIRVVNPDGSGETFLTCRPIELVGRGPGGEVMDTPASPFANPARAATWAPDGRQIAFSRWDIGGNVAPDVDYLFTLNPDGTQNLFGDDDGSPSWSPDSERVAFVSTSFSGDFFEESETSIVVANRDGSGRTTLAEGGDQPAWSPVGERIAFVRDGDVSAVNTDGSDEVSLTDSPASESSPAWSPDGRRIAFTRFDQEASAPGVWAMNADGSDQALLAERAARPDWSPDGRRIAFRRDGEIWVMNADGSDARRLLAESGRATWSPDGKRIALERQRRDGGSLVSDIWVINIAGGDERRLVSGRGPDWQTIPPGMVGNPGPSQFCFTALRRNKNRGVARLVVEVSRPGRVVLKRGPGVRPFARAHREAGPGRVVLPIRPRGRVKRTLERRAIVRVPVGLRVTYRPRNGEPRTRSGRIRLIKAPRRCRDVDNERVRVIRIEGTLGCKRIRRLAAATVYRTRFLENRRFYCDWSLPSRWSHTVKVDGRTYTRGSCQEKKSRLRVSFLGLRKKTDLWARTFTSITVTEGGKPRSLLPGTRLRMHFRPFDVKEGRGAAEWSAGCGRLSTGVRVTSRQMRFARIWRAWPDCGEDHQRQSDWLSDFFDSDPGWRLRDRRLVLRSAGIVIRLREGRG